MARFSTVVTIVDGGAALRRCLAALRAQEGVEGMEVIVPYDHLTREAAALAGEFRDMRFLDLGPLLGGTHPRNPAEMHRFYDRRRALGLAAATGDLVGMVEDRGAPEPSWAREMMALHGEGQFGAVGGAVACGGETRLARAIFFCDFGRYQAPLDDPAPDWVTDTNVVYSRAALEAVRSVWAEYYEEPPVHAAMRRAGFRLRLSDRAVTVQRREDLAWGPVLSERFHWARVFARIRAREAGLAGRLKYALAAPLLPPLLLLRHGRRQQAKGHSLPEFRAAMPAMLVLLAAWAAGEAWGSLFPGRPR